MTTATRRESASRIVEAHEPLAARIARAAAQANDFSPAVADKVKLCLLDLVGCACEARELPWSRQAAALAERAADPARGATLIGTPVAVTSDSAAFANAVMGHGLVREDMHAGSVSHLGIVVLPALMALAQYRPVRGRDFIAAAMVGYETGGQLGRALMEPDIARIHRPTGLTGPVGAAAAAARLLGLGVAQATSAGALGAHLTLGLNQCAHTGGSEMFCHSAFAARNAPAAARLAEAGAFASPSALDGEAGLFAAFRKRSAAAAVELFRGEPEILSVYHKPVPACNFAQTACQAALAIARDARPAPENIAAIEIRVPLAGARYPGCDYSGPFAHVLQAKMSIQYNVAAALIAGGVSEGNFTLLKDARLHRLIALTTLQVDEAMSAAYPASQGGEVAVTDSAGAVHRVRLADVVNAAAADVRARFRAAAAALFGAARAGEIEAGIDALERCEDVGRLVALTGGRR